jgi:hypothetical protein
MIEQLIFVGEEFGVREKAPHLFHAPEDMLYGVIEKGDPERRAHPTVKFGFRDYPGRSSMLS